MAGRVSSYHFSLHIDVNEYQRYYKGTAQNVVVMSREGLRVQFPASALRPFVSNNGVQGHFVLKMDENNKLIGLQRL